MLATKLHINYEIEVHYIELALKPSNNNIWNKNANGTHFIKLTLKAKT